MDNNAYILTKDGELYHYGVLGMKWGVHRAQQRQAKYDAKIRNAKQTGEEDIKEWKEIGQYRNKDVSKQIARSRKITNKQVAKFTKKKNKGQKITKRTQNAVNKMTTGEKIGKSMLFGSYGALVYTSARTKGVSRGKAAVQAITNNWANNLTLGQLSKKTTW